VNEAARASGSSSGAPPGAGTLADPLRERRAARLLGAFIAAGLFFLALPGTLAGVWNLVDISAARNSGAAPASWIQAHGHAQLFGWVGSFIFGISLYALPKFRGAFLRSIPAGWTIFFVWTAATALRWASSFWGWRPEIVWPAAAAGQFIAAALLLWAASPSRRRRVRFEAWNVLILAGLLGLWATAALQFAVAWEMARQGLSVVPPEANERLLLASLWLFLLPVVAGFAARFLPVFLGTAAPRRGALLLALAATYLAVLTEVLAWPGWAERLTLIAVLLVCYGLRVFEPARRPPKVRGVHPAFPYFARLAFFWLPAAAVLQLAGSAAGWTGASRHAFTVGFLATLILSMAPRILPSFLNSRELWSPRLMFWSLAALTFGCALRVSAEPLAYGGAAGWSWSLLPASAFIELAALLLFAYNILRSMATPVPAWFGREQVRETMPVYWYLASYPSCRRALVNAGLKSLARGGMPPRDLTLREAAEANEVDYHDVAETLGGFLEQRLARSVRNQRRDAAKAELCSEDRPA